MVFTYHKTREAIASKAVQFFHVDGKKNYADVLSKHWGRAQVWDLLKELLFKHQGNIKGNEKRKMLEANQHVHGFGELQHDRTNGTNADQEEALYSLNLVFGNVDGEDEGLEEERAEERAQDAQMGRTKVELTQLDDNWDWLTLWQYQY